MKTIKQLVAEHNAIAGATPLKSWKQSAAKLAARIEKLRPKEQPKPQPKREPAESIRDFVEGMLQEVVGEHPKKHKPLGHTYEHILAETAKAYPEAATTVACLRWYATHLNRRKDVRLPVRERAKPKRRAA